MIQSPNDTPFSNLIDKFSLTLRLAESLFNSVINQFPEAPLNLEDIEWEHPKNSDNGDYSTNVAMRWQRLLAVTTGSHVGEIIQAQNKDNLFHDPQELALALKQEWVKNLPKEVVRIDAINGFLNIWLNNEYLINQIGNVLGNKEGFCKNEVLSGKKILLEHTSPNPQTTIMLGHLRNNFLGMACANLLKNAGADVKLDCVVNDRGVHICRSMWGYLFFANKKIGLSKVELANFKQVDLAGRPPASTQGDALEPAPEPNAWKVMLNEWVVNPKGWWTPGELELKPDHANLIWYVLGSRAYREIEGVESQVHQILKDWEANDRSIRRLWKQIINWSEEGYATTYQRIGSYHDKYWYESDHWREGKDIVEVGIKKGIFKTGDVDPKNGKKPIVTDLAQDGLPDTVVIKSDGTGLYMTQDLALTRLKIKTFPSDYYIWDIGSEQTVYFCQLFAVVDKLKIAKKEQIYHLCYALINFKGGGKMATRKGDVVAADETIDLQKERTLQIIAKSNQKNREKLTDKELGDLAEKIAVGALKYSLLKFSRETTMQFDIDESLSLTGNSGPYIQYTYARARSVLAKSEIRNPKSENNSKYEFNKEEKGVMRTIYLFPEVVLQATRELAPNMVCNYLFDLAQKFNLFYDKHRILTSDQLSVNSDQEMVISNQGIVISDEKAGKDNSVPTTNHQPLVTDNQSSFRLILTSVVGQVIKNGLTLLGIEVPERM